MSIGTYTSENTNITSIQMTIDGFFKPQKSFNELLQDKFFHDKLLLEIDQIVHALSDGKFEIKCLNKFKL